MIQGLVSGLAYPSTYNLFNKWSSPEERATIMSFVFAGIPVAIIVNYPFSSALCESGIDGGWPLVFYIPGNGYLVYDDNRNYRFYSNEIGISMKR